MTDEQFNRLIVNVCLAMRAAQCGEAPSEESYDALAALIHEAARARGNEQKLARRVFDEARARACLAYCREGD